MRRAFVALIAAAFPIGCANGEPDTPKNTPRELSHSADSMMMTLAVSSSKPLSGVELCDNGGICGEDQIAAAKELADLDFVELTTTNEFRLTDAGNSYIKAAYRIARDGDHTVVEKRQGSAE